MKPSNAWSNADWYLGAVVIVAAIVVLRIAYFAGYIVGFIEGVTR